VSIGVWDCWAVAVKAVLYAAVLMPAGAVFFLAYSDSLLGAQDRLVIGRLIAVCVAIALLATAARILVTAASMSGDASGMFDAGLTGLVWRGGEGAAARIRAAGLLLALLAVWRKGRCGPIALAGAAAAATSFAWVGHTHAAGAPWLEWLIGAHLCAAAFWIGALGPLAVLARHGEPRRIGAAAARFGRAAVVAVGVLVLAGVLVLWVLLGRVSELWASSYGRIAAAKLAAVACLLALAGLNKLRLIPRILAGDARAVRALRRSIGAEMIAAALILIATAALTTLAGPPGLD